MLNFYYTTLFFISSQDFYSPIMKNITPNVELPNCGHNKKVSKDL